MLASSSCNTLSSKCISRAPLNTIVEKLSSIRRKPLCPQKRSSTEMQDETEDGTQGPSDVQNAVNSEKSASLRRKANKPCKYVRDDTVNHEDINLENYEPNRKRSRRRNISLDISSTLDNLSLRSGRMLKGPVSGIVKKLVQEMIGKVALEVDHLPEPPCRPGRRPKAWFTPNFGMTSTSSSIQLKRRRGRPPKFNNEDSSSTIIPRLISDILNRVCWEVDGIITPRRRGRPPKTNSVPKSTTPRPRGRPRGSLNKIYSNGLSESRRGRFPGRRGRPPKYFLASFCCTHEQDSPITNAIGLNEHRNGIPVSLAHRRGRGSRTVVPYPLTDVHATMLLTRKRGRPPKFCLSHSDKKANQFQIPEYSTFVSSKSDIQCQQSLAYRKYSNVRWYT